MQFIKPHGFLKSRRSDHPPNVWLEIQFVTDNEKLVDTFDELLGWRVFWKIRVEAAQSAAESHHCYRLKGPQVHFKVKFPFYHIFLISLGFHSKTFEFCHCFVEHKFKEKLVPTVCYNFVVNNISIEKMKK